ncbi:MAG: hypothetical protein A2V70_01205 [Planctomycetes bacterium RBG_13_63_9]|nr:MAG: hypothetical protein A2V70_01205 [Planctomycetes bacterium RBG_13_63_9]
MKQDTESAIIVAGFAIFTVALVAGGILLARKMKEAEDAEAKAEPVPPPASSPVGYEPVD